MDKTLVEKINNSALENKLYEFFKDNNEFWSSYKFNLKYNYWRGKQSKWSLAFDGQCLKYIFGIDSPMFCSKYHAAINGGGHEEKKITTLHSSSLLSLLVFFSVSDDNPIFFNIDGKKVKFTKSEFEVKNEVCENSNNYSNVDVVLYGNDSVLYLESKFSEYLTAQSEEVKRVKYYDDIYERLSEALTASGVRLDDNAKGKRVLCKATNKPVYCEGLKQMISHYLGVVTEIQRDDNFKGKQIFLGEIVFDFGKLLNASDKLDSYKEAYEHLKEGLQNCVEDDIKGKDVKLTIMDMMTYQSVLGLDDNRDFLKNMSEKIKQYYRF